MLVIPALDGHLEDHPPCCKATDTLRQDQITRNIEGPLMVWFDHYTGQ